MRTSILIIILILFSCKTRLSSNTTALDLSNQKLKSIPDSVFLLVNLKYLYLGNSFTLYPPLSALGQDGPSGSNMNQIEEISDDIGQLKNLKVLNLTANDLKKLPKEIIQLRHLDTLDLSFNIHFSVFNDVDVLRNMNWLKYLNIVATNFDERTIEKLRKTLPTTRIITKLDDIKEDISE